MPQEVRQRAQALRDEQDAAGQQFVKRILTGSSSTDSNSGSSSSTSSSDDIP
jgi:hypothetical protein